MEAITNNLFSVDLLNQPGADLMLAFATKLLAGIVTIIIGFWLAGRASRLLVDSISKIDRIDKTILPMIGALVRYAGMILTLVVALGKFGVETTSIIAVLGAAGLAIGLALQGSLSNFAAGILIVIYRPYKVGDYIQADNHLGTVDDIQIFSTVLKTPDNKLVIVPNGSIMNGSIVNFSNQDKRRVDIIASCSYEDDIDKVKSVLADILSQDDRILSEPEPRIAVSELADSSVNLIVRPWVKNSDYINVYYSLLEEIKKRFDQEGISIPYPQSDVHIHNHTE